MSPGRIRIIILTGIVCIGSCAGPRYLKSVNAGPEEITGTCDLFLYGHRYADDFNNVAFLIPWGGKYAFGLYAPEFDYAVRKGLPAGSAIEEAERFVKFHYSFQRSQWKKILDQEGNVIGYELRPIYSAPDFPYSDILDVHYVIEGGKVVASVGLRPEIEERPPEPFLLRPKVR
jgi:hypothetical protein